MFNNRLSKKIISCVVFADLNDIKYFHQNHFRATEWKDMSSNTALYSIATTKTQR